MEISNGIRVVKNLFAIEKCEEWIDLCETEGFDEAPVNVGRRKTHSDMFCN